MKSISNNLPPAIFALLQRKEIDILLLTSKVDMVIPSINFFLAQNTDLKKISILCSYKPDFSTGLKFPYSDIEEKTEYWCASDYLGFIRARLPVELKNRNPLYEGDRSRLGFFKQRILMGSLFGYYKKINDSKLPRILKSVLSIFFSFVGMLLKLTLKSERSTRGYWQALVNDVIVRVYFDGGPDKDHYGESPIIIEKLAEMDSVITKDNALPICFFFMAGPRHYYIQHILNKEDKGEISNFLLIAKEMYRPETAKVIFRRPGAYYIKGNNVDDSGSRIYSDHCLSIGADEKELWVYEAV
jgi:hypothetical protein